NVRKILDDVVLYRLRTTLRERQIRRGGTGAVRVSLDTQHGASEGRHRLTQLVEQQVRTGHDRIRARRELNLDLLMQNRHVLRRRRLRYDRRLFYFLAREAGGNSLEEARIRPVLRVHSLGDQTLLAPDNECGVEQ